MTIATTSIERLRLRFGECGPWWEPFNGSFTGRYQEIGGQKILEITETVKHRCGFLWLKKNLVLRCAWVPAAQFRLVKHGYTDSPREFIGE